MRVVDTSVVTRHGRWTLHAFEDKPSERPIAVLVMGTVRGQSDVLVRIQSECLTGHVFETLSCDCKPQLDYSLDRIAQEGRGLLVYLAQEGRGIGLMGKVSSYALQAEGLDTFDANLQLGFAVDERSYGEVAEILRFFQIGSIRLITNNPARREALERAGVAVTVQQTPMFSRPENRRYLETKRDRMHHVFGE